MDISVPNTGAGLKSADTAGFTLGYFVTDHIAVVAVMGIPPKFDITGSGSFSQYGKIGSAKQWSPTLLFKYYFRDPTAKFRPYVGMGVTYTWFTDEKITNSAFENGVLHGPTDDRRDLIRAPVLNAGFVYNFTEHWFAGFSFSYVPLSTTAKLTSQAATPVGTLALKTEARSAQPDRDLPECRVPLRSARSSARMKTPPRFLLAAFFYSFHLNVTGRSPHEAEFLRAPVRRRIPDRPSVQAIQLVSHTGIELAHHSVFMPLRRSMYD